MTKPIWHSINHTQTELHHKRNHIGNLETLNMIESFFTIKQPALRSIKPRVFHTVACLTSNFIESFSFERISSSSTPSISLTESLSAKPSKRRHYNVVWSVRTLVWLLNQLRSSWIQKQRQSPVHGAFELTREVLAEQFLAHNLVRSLQPSHILVLPKYFLH